MKKPATGASNSERGVSTRASRGGPAPKIHPVVVYPFVQPRDCTDLEELYGLVARLDADRERYARPITVMDRKTHYATEHNRAFHEFRDKIVARHSDVLHAWCVDTCQMWYVGLGAAFEQGAPADVYWLIPGDFNYGHTIGKEVLGHLHDLPEIVLELHHDICIGEISADHTNPKQLIDTYGTFGLLYNWFPAEAREIRQYTERPRSEFFAVRHGFLQEMLRKRWFPHEQTVVMLLHAVFANRRISRFSVGNLSDLPEGRESFASALQQVERTELVLRTLWRERHSSRSGWTEEYRVLEAQSENVRRAAMVILRNLLD